MKGNIKLVIGIIIGILISGTVAFAASNVYANSIVYNNTTVDVALNDLYNRLYGSSSMTTGEAFLIIASKGLSMHHNTDPYSATFTMSNMDFSNIKSFTYSYTLTTDDYRYQSVKLTSENNTYIDIEGNVVDQVVTINGTSDLVTFQYIVSNYNTGVFKISSYTRMDNSIASFN